MSVRINDTFTEGQKRFSALLKLYKAPEPEYQIPKIWPHQVPVEKRIK